jgi:hypothetical protein
MDYVIIEPVFCLSARLPPERGIDIRPAAPLQLYGGVKCAGQA